MSVRTFLAPLWKRLLSRLRRKLRTSHDTHPWVVPQILAAREARR